MLAVARGLLRPTNWLTGCSSARGVRGRGCCGEGGGGDRDLEVVVVEVVSLKKKEKEHPHLYAPSNAMSCISITGIQYMEVSK